MRMTDETREDAPRSMMSESKEHIEEKLEVIMQWRYDE